LISIADSFNISRGQKSFKP